MSENVPTGMPSPEERMEVTPDTKKAFFELVSRLTAGGKHSGAPMPSLEKDFSNSSKDIIVRLRGNVDESRAVASGMSAIIGGTIIARAEVNRVLKGGNKVRWDKYLLFRSGSMKHKGGLFDKSDAFPSEEKIQSW